MTVLGIDTSNYTTSAALFDGTQVRQKKQLLPVKPGSVGLRQSDAVFHHVQQLPALLDELFQGEIQPLSVVGVSVRPRNLPGSYMPCFLTGRAVARSVASAMGLPCHEFSHQEGHIMAALYSARQIQLAEEPFLAFHVSGGTTEALLVKPSAQGVFDCSVVAQSLDLKAGQAIDRVGSLLGLPFPAGMAMEELAKRSDASFSVKPVMKGCDCCLSGIENQCRDHLKRGMPREDVAKFCITSVLTAVEGMTRALKEQYPGLPVLYAGGVMSNTEIQTHLTGRYQGLFARPEFSGDNGAGVAILAWRSEHGTDGNRLQTEPIH